MNYQSKKPKSPSITPSTAKLMQLRAGKGLGMLSQEEIELLRKSKKEISEMCRKYSKLIIQKSDKFIAKVMPR
ncbi:hypothetical protein ASG44_07750 [Methylophilus sp. Leaf459]|nr:hypothetical protein ASG34_07775 [Methylophilus sp. Leaf416]KQT56800.1 hypothetical protein ASG44_07750 [Methylophilus sp. Leaf459]